MQLKSDELETLMSGKYVTIIENGTSNEKNLRKLRLPVDKLEAIYIWFDKSTNFCGR
ncbi:YetF domain-containing protein [Aneurinibacillus aneurinilyticus]|uniref:YetF C-terminal domain-containing protein n=1 Tax=Aneurinibacillus aneurinilyticus ATCC 12856 TaxID=649747 RepID=U1X420_ANEAE|nr:YetF domain-containing protein [Aneurinibacillus aneurinilyticus]ERI09263.1 hypothetical protein HMPREF0083_02648 [Aneurinibacillus aneurinilyticus ATCC 12856]